jgi:hypothetical protein
MVEADCYFKLLPTSILDMYKVFEHIPVAMAMTTTMATENCHCRPCHHCCCNRCHLGHPHCLGNSYCHHPCHCHHRHHQPHHCCCHCHCHCCPHHCPCCCCCGFAVAMDVTLPFPLLSMLLLPLLSPLPLPVTITIGIAVVFVVHIIVAIPILFTVAFSTPSYHGWLLCVGRTGLDIMDVVFASQIVIVVIIVSLPSPAEERRVETCKGGRGCSGNYLGINTAPLLCCGRAGEGSKMIFSWSSPLTTSLKTVFFCKNGQSYKKNKIF